jgi:signal transduction histidine kinase
MRTRPAWRSELTVELSLAAGVALVTVAGIGFELHYSPDPYPDPVPAFALAVLASGVLVLRRRRPWAVAVVVLAAVLSYHLLGYPGLAVAMASFFAAYSLAAYGTGRRALLGCAALIVGVWVAPTIPPHPVPWYAFAITGPVLGLAWIAVVGYAAGQRRRAADERVHQADRTAQALLAQRLAEERLHIARELHDVLAHTVSVISVQAGVALDALDDDVEAARTALHVVRAAARQAGPELRAAVGPLRTFNASDGPVPPPAPRLDGVGELLRPAAAAGLVTGVRVEPGPDPLPHPVELTAYRIVQESLTNVVRHAHASRVDVVVSREGDVLVVDVRDDGTGGADRASGAGLGVVGMRERAQLLGGTVEAGPAESGGFRVLARLPVGSA